MAIYTENAKYFYFGTYLIKMPLILLMCVTQIAYSESRFHREITLNHTSTNVDDITALQDANVSNYKKDLTKSRIQSDKIEKLESSREYETVIKNVKLNSEPFKKVDNNNEKLKVSFSDNATELIKKLTKVVEKVNTNLAIYNKLLKPVARKHRRHNLHDYSLDMIPPLARNKRSIKNISEIETAPNSIDIPNNFKIIVPDNATVAYTEVANKTKESENNSDDWLVNNSNNTDEENRNITELVNGRRSFSSDIQMAKALRSRLLSYVHDHINDTMYKIDSLKNVKDSYATNNAFNIGYIIANVDLIDINLRKLRDGIEKDHHEWAESHILDVYDKVKYTNDVITSLLTALKTVFNHPPNVNEYLYVK